MNKKQLKAFPILLIFVLAVVLYHLFAYTGPFGFDDLHYAKLANGLLHGNVDLEDHYAYRFPVILFTAFFYLIFGVSDLASSLPALIITLVILILVFNILREQGVKTIITGLSLSTFSNWFLFYSDKLMPDIYVALAVLLVLAVLHSYKYRGRQKHPMPAAFLLALSLLFGFMSKGTIVLMLPLLLYLFLTDIIRKRDLKFWLYTLVSGTGLLALYFFLIWILTGEAMKRFEVIADSTYLNPCSYDQQSLRILLKRIVIGFFELSMVQSLATSFIFIAAALIQKRSRRYFRLDDSFSFFLVSALLLFFSSNFMSISPGSYSPMCLDPRHYLFLLPVAAIPASKIIVDFLETRRFAIQIIMALLIVTVISFFLQGSTFWKLYLPLTLLFTIYFFTRPGSFSQRLFIPLLAAILLLIPLEMVNYSGKVRYRMQRKIAMEQVIDSRMDHQVISNEVQKRLLNYYSGFDSDQGSRFLSYDEINPGMEPGVKKLLFLNEYTRYLSGMTLDDLPYYARNISPDHIPVFENRDAGISLFDVTETDLTAQPGIPLYSTLNDFEGPATFWKQSDRDLSRETSYSGAKSNRVTVFSSTFELPLDSLHRQEAGGLLVRCSLFCLAEDRTNTKIVVSLEDSRGTFFWKALEMNRYLKAYSNWWPVSFEVRVPPTDLKPDSRLKVYVWKTDKTEVFVDNFSVRISEVSSP